MRSVNEIWPVYVTLQKKNIYQKKFAKLAILKAGYRSFCVCKNQAQSLLENRSFEANYFYYQICNSKTIKFSLFHKYSSLELQDRLVTMKWIQPLDTRTYLKLLALFSNCSLKSNYPLVLKPFDFYFKKFLKKIPWYCSKMIFVVIHPILCNVLF